MGIKAWWYRMRNPMGCVVITPWGQRTPRPQVSVGVASIRGAQTVYTYDANDQGNASATMHGRSLARILGCRLVDERDEPIKESQS